MSHGMWTRTSPERLWSWSDRPYYTIPESRQKYVSLNDWTSGWIPPTNCSGTRVSCPEDCCLVPCPGALSDHSSGHPHTHLGALHCGKPPSRAGLGFFALVFLWFGPVPQQPLAHLNRPVASNLGHPRAGPNTTLIRTFVAYRCLGGGGVWGGGLSLLQFYFVLWVSFCVPLVKMDTLHPTEAPCLSQAPTPNLRKFPSMDDNPIPPSTTIPGET